MLRRTITCGRPLVEERVSTYCVGDCISPSTPISTASMRKISPAFAPISISSVVEKLRKLPGFVDALQVAAHHAGVHLTDGGLAVNIVGHHLIEVDIRFAQCKDVRDGYLSNLLDDLFLHRAERAHLGNTAPRVFPGRAAIAPSRSRKWRKLLVNVVSSTPSPCVVVDEVFGLGIDHAQHCARLGCALHRSPVQLTVTGQAHQSVAVGRHEADLVFGDFLIEKARTVDPSSSPRRTRP